MSSCILQLDRITGRNHERNKYSPCRCACVFSHPRNNDCSSRRRSEDEDILLTNLLSSPPLFDHAVSVDCRSSPIQLQTDLPPYSLHTHTHTHTHQSSMPRSWQVANCFSMALHKLTHAQQMQRERCRLKHGCSTCLGRLLYIRRCICLHCL